MKKGEILIGIPPFVFHRIIKIILDYKKCNLMSLHYL